MFSTLVRFVRPTAAAAAVLVMAGLVPAAPAAAAPRAPSTQPWLYVTSHAVYPYDRVPGYPGYDPARPADAGTAPGSVSLVVEITNNDPQAVRDIAVTTGVRPSGQAGAIRCSTTPVTSDEAYRASTHPQAPRRDPQERPSSRGSSQSGASSSWSDPTLVLAQYQTLYCSIVVSGITDDVVHEDDTDVTAVYADTGEAVTGSTYMYMAAGALRPAAPGPVSVGWLVWVDVNPDNLQRLDQGEPGIAGQHLTITGPDGLPPHDYPSGESVDRAVTTSRTGTYHFRSLRPFTTYTVTLDLASPALANLVKSPNAPGTVSPDGSSWSMKVSTADYDSNFGLFALVAKNPLKVTVNSPVTAVAGTSVQVLGAAWRPGPGGGWDGHAVLEFQPAGTTGFYSWTKVADVTSHRGQMTTRVTATRSGWYRYRVPGDSSTAPAISRPDHLVVTLAPVVLTITAPRTGRQGAPITVTGTITRAGTPFRTGRTVLEYSSDASSWTTVADVRSTDGTLTTTVQPARTGSYRFRYLGDSKTAPGTSPASPVVVTPAANARSTPHAPR